LVKEVNAMLNKLKDASEAGAEVSNDYGDYFGIPTPLPRQNSDNLYVGKGMNWNDRTIRHSGPSEATNVVKSGLIDDKMVATEALQAKQVSFELLLRSGEHSARKPMQMIIFPYDTPRSIITTVRKFYWLSESVVVMLEDRNGTTLLPSYESLAHNMVVYVRVSKKEIVTETRRG
jgi:hypothetical protein